MPNSLTPARWERIKSVFCQALELQPQERPNYLDSSCGNDLVVRRQVELLIAHHESASDFLETPIADAASLLESALGGSPSTFAIGDFLNNRFRILRFIGKGGMGEVYEAADELGGVRVALKTIRSAMAIDDQLKAQFLHEVQIARQITHPNVCRIHDLFECTVPDPSSGATRQVVFLTMELLEGESLTEFLARHGRMRMDEALPVIRDVVAALSAAHEQGIIHRDLKSSNVMLVPTKAGGRRAVLTDFGLAEMRDPRAPDPLTASGFAGTPDYMAPEQIQRGNVSFTADIFSLGVVMYEMVAGRRPFSGSSTLTGAARRADSAVDPPRRLAPDLNPRWERAILRCLELNPARRYPHARELLSDLEGRERKARIARRTAVAAVLLASCAAAWWWKERGIQSPGRVTSVAVLPFQQLAGDPDTEYFAEGVTDELIQTLTRLPGMRVTARGSSAQFRAAGDVKAVGKALGVQAVLTGALRKQGGRVTVMAQLINLQDGQWLWSGRFDEVTRLLPRVRVNLSMAIAGALQSRLSEVQLAGIGGPETDNAEAYRLYLLGKHHAGYRTDEGLKLGIDYLEQSIANDPNFPPAYAELAEEYNMVAGHPDCPPEVYFPKAEAAAMKAIALDPNSGEAHTSLGLSYQRYRWDWAAAEHEFKEALRLSGGLALAHHRFSGFLSNLGQHDAALQEIHIAENLDPLSAPIRTAHGVFLYRARRYDEALQQFENTRRMFPSFVVVLPEMADVYRIKGSWDQALAAYQEADKLSDRDHFRLAGEASVLVRLGYVAQAQAMVQELEAGFGTKHYSAAAIAYAYRGLGDADKTFHWFDVAADRREPTLMEVKVDPANDPLRADPRFSKLLERLRL
jgi:serine/threonine-protein kinase